MQCLKSVRDEKEINERNIYKKKTITNNVLLTNKRCQPIAKMKAISLFALHYFLFRWRIHTMVSFAMTMLTAIRKRITHTRTELFFSVIFLSAFLRSFVLACVCVCVYVAKCVYVQRFFFRSNSNFNSDYYFFRCLFYWFLR